MRSVRRLLTMAAIVLTPLASIATGATPASAAVTPVLSIDAVTPTGNALWVNVSLTGISSYQQYTVTVKCVGTHSVSAECFSGASYGMAVTSLSDFSASGLTGSGFNPTSSSGTYIESYTGQMNAGGTTSTSDATTVIFPNLITGMSYTVTASATVVSTSLTAQYGSPTATVLTLGSDGVTNVTMTPAGQTDGEGQMGCYYYCYNAYQSYGVYTGSKVTVNWTKPAVKQSVTYWSGQSYQPKTQKTYTPSGYAVLVLPTNLVRSGASYNAMNRSMTWWQYLSSLQSASAIASQGFYGNQTQLESDGCSALESGAGNWGISNSIQSAFSFAWYIDGTDTTSVTLNGCHFARDEQYTAIVEPVFMPSSITSEMTSTNIRAPYQWDRTQKLFPYNAVLTNTSYYGGSGWSAGTAPILTASTSSSYRADGSAGNLSAEPGSASSVTAVPGSTTDPNLKGSLKVSWTAPTRDLYYSTLSADVFAASSNASQLNSWGLSMPTKVTSGFQASTPTNYLVTAVRQDSSAWFGYLGWNGLAGKSNYVSCTAVAPATTCTLTGLGTWTKYYVIVQAQTANATGWADFIQINPSTGSGSTIWPLAPSKPLNITASNPTTSSTQLAWDVPASVGGPTGVAISKYTATMVPQFVPVQQLTTSKYSTGQYSSGWYSTSPYGVSINGGDGAYWMDPLQGNNNYVGFLGYGCNNSSQYQNYTYLNTATCYNVFSPKGFVAKYDINSIFNANSTLKMGNSAATFYSLFWMHNERDGYLFEYEMFNGGSSYTWGLAFAPATSTSATLNASATPPVIPGGPDFSKAYVITTMGATSLDGSYQGSIGSTSLTSAPVDAHMLNATTAVVAFATAPTAGNNPSTTFYKYTLNSATAPTGATKAGTASLTLGCYSSPQAVCDDYTNIKNTTSLSGTLYPVSSFSLNPVTGSIYFQSPWSGGGGYLTAKTYRVNYDATAGTYGSPAMATVNASTTSNYGCYYYCGGSSSLSYTSYQQVRFDNSGKVSFPYALTQYTEVSGSGDMQEVAGTNLPVQTWDWWFTPTWVGYRGYGSGGAVRTPGGAIFSTTSRWGGKATDQTSWNNYSSTLSVMLDSSTHTCTATAPSTTCTVNGTVKGAAYAITVYATNRESNGTTKDGPAGDFANVVAGVPNAPRYSSATIGAATGSPSAAPVTITFNPSLKAGGLVDTTVTKYTCTVYDTSGNRLASVDVTPPSTLTPTTALTCTPPGTLAVGDSYILQMTATSAEGTSMPATAPQLVVAIPVPPQGITYDTTKTPAAVTWGTPGTGTNKVTFYTGSVSPGSGNTVSGTAASGVSCTVTGSTCTPTGLTPNTTYTVLVCTTNSLTTGADSTTGALTNMTTTPPSFKNCTAQSFTTPAEAKPSNPTLTLAPSNGALVLTWDKPAANGTTITGYTVSVSPSATTTGCTALAATATSCTLGGLTNGTSYTVTLKVSYTINGNTYTTTSTVSDAESMTPFAPPAAVAKPTATAGNAKATINWTAVTAPAGMTINSYTVTASPGGLTCTVNAPATTCDVSGLTNGTAYTFAVTANYTNNNVSPAITEDTTASAPSTAVTPQATAPTAAPTNVTTSAGNGSVTVSFDAVTDNGGSAITSYTVTSSPGGKTCTVNAPATSCAVSGLTNGTAYTFTVKANNAKGAGPASSPSGSVTPQATKPGAPSGVTATIKSGTSLSVKWTAPTDNGGSPVTSYTVSATDGNTTKTCTVNAPALTCDVTGLTQGTPYTVSVVATNYVGDSNAASAASEVAPATAPSTITAPTATVGSTSATVTWTAPASNGADITKYTVTSVPGGKTCTLNAPFPDPLSCTVNGLTIGTNYTFTVTATNGAGTSTSSSPSNQITGASAPAGLSAPTVTAPANNNSNGQLTVTWKAPTAANGTISGYTVTASPGGATCTTSGALSCTVSGLTNGTAYTFTVKATNQIGDSAASAASPAATPSTKPDAPTAVTVTAGVASTTVSWTAPANNGGATITKYTVTASPGGAICTTTGALTCKVTGLTNGTAYTFTVKATNINGDSPLSDTSASASPAPLASAPSVTGASRSGSNSVTVNFTRPTDPSGAPITGYVVTAQPGGKTCVVADPSILSCTFDDLTPGTAYTFTVTATNRIGNSANSTASPKVTAATNPGAPTAVTAGLDPMKKTVDRSALVTWKAPTYTGGLLIKGYLVTASPGGAYCVAIAPATSCKVAGLNNGTEYNFSVITVNGPAVDSTTPGTNLESEPATTTTGFTPVWSNQIAKSVDLTPPTGPSGGSTTSALYSMPVTIHFSPTPPATSYTIKVNGRILAVLSASACSATVCDFTWTPANKYILRTSDVITVVSSNGHTISMTPPAPTSLAVAELHYGSGLSTVVAGSAEAQFLDSVAQLVKDNGYLKVSFLGYTDDDGSAAANMTLSQTRATNASNYLKSALSKLGVTNVVLSAVGKGISTTYGTGCSANGASDGCAKNRRVSVVVSGQQSSPAKPSDPNTVVRNNDIKVSWTAPSNNGSAITGYTVYYTTDDDYQLNGAPLSTDPTDIGNWTEYCTTTTALNCSAPTGSTVVNGTAYAFVVVAQNAKGESQVSDVSDSTTPATTAPDAPAVTVSAIGKTGFSINATVPTYTGGSDITGYSYTVLQGTTTVKSGVLTPGTPVVITGLKAATAYTVKVTATNGVGTSVAGTKATTTLA